MRQNQLASVSIIGHSLSGATSLLYAGLFPETVRRLIIVEGTWQLDPAFAKRSREPIERRMLGWMDQLRELAARTPRSYRTLQEAVERMLRESPHLSADQARHLTEHGVVQNQDGSFRWKFDNYIRTIAPNHFAESEVTELWSRIHCPVLLLLHGTDSHHADPRALNLLQHFQNARSREIADAGHWLHHDQLGEFLSMARSFLAN